MSITCLRNLFVLLILICCVPVIEVHADTGNSTAPSAGIARDTGYTFQTKRVFDRNEAPLDSMSSNWKMETLDTTAGAESLDENEKKIIIEINTLRADPAEYARRFLVPLRAYYRNKVWQFNDDFSIITDEGVDALDECINELVALKPVGPLSPAEGLTFAARDHMKDQNQTGAIGHDGSDGSTMENRIDRYGRWKISCGENIFYGLGDARLIVILLLVDDGVPSRDHRINLLNASFKYVGVAVGPHKVLKQMCIMDFAGLYIEKEYGNGSGSK